MSKIRIVEFGEWDKHCIYMCQGCGYEHAFSPNVHKWNGDLNNPTVTPSLLLNNPQGHHTCHSHITAGQIIFADDSWHELKGKTVPLPEIEEE